ncbi:hypothetical protein HAV21_11100 [Paenarthrobacter sp. MSM-2-10-13]|nr:hypothetical protein [Paenarthrobacter sp. MSM-2-10-13]
MKRADTFELPGSDLSGEERQVGIIPIQNDAATSDCCTGLM